MTWIILLAAVGITLITLEVVIPGGILGVMGALCLLGACAWSYHELGSLGGLATTASVLVAGGIILWLEFRLLPRTPLGRRAFLTRSITSVSASYGEEARALIGKPAVAITTLSPSGYVRIGQQRYEAFCQSGHTVAGTALTVVGADNFRLIVAPAASSSDEQRPS